jgi:mono/diheme cytochrome c family protein
MKKTVFVLCIVLAFSGLAAALPQAQEQSAKDVPANVLEIIKKRCSGCHWGKSPSKGLNLEPGRIQAAIDAPSKEMPAMKIIDTADPEASYLLKKVQGAGDIKGSRMPRFGKKLPAADTEILKAWLTSLKNK